MMFRPKNSHCYSQLGFENTCTQPGWQIQTEEEIIEAVTQLSTEKQDDKDPQNNTDLLAPTHSQAFEASETFLNRYEMQSEAEFSTLMVIKQVRDPAAFKEKNQCQTTQNEILF